MQIFPLSPETGIIYKCEYNQCFFKIKVIVTCYDIPPRPSPMHGPGPEIQKNKMM